MHASRLTLFLCGDVMTGRGIDQILPYSSPPHLFEPVVRSAGDYIALAELAHGEIPRRTGFDYVWGEALELLDRYRPDARIVNLETSVTSSQEALPKGINYRMHPANVPALTVAGIDCCVLANNHVLDWGTAGLLETLEVLDAAGIAGTGAGRNLEEATAPAVLAIDGRRRVLVFAYAFSDSGVPHDWRAGADRAGVALLPDLSDRTADAIGERIAAIEEPGDVVVASLHWGPNWGYAIPRTHRRFARALIDRAGVDVVHGHSSHHPKGIEVYRERLILYGCGDFLDDYEGITGYERFRDDLVVMYLPTLDARTGSLIQLDMVPLQIRRFRLNVPSLADVRWLHAVLARECGRFGHRVTERDGVLRLEQQ